MKLRRKRWRKEQRKQIGIRMRREESNERKRGKNEEKKQLEMIGMRKRWREGKQTGSSGSLEFKECFHGSNAVKQAAMEVNGVLKGAFFVPVVIDWL